MENDTFKLKQFIIITLITSVWIHITEIFRAVVIVFPRMKAFFENKVAIGDIELSNALIWGFWDTLLTACLVFIFWLCVKTFENHFKSVLISATVTCAATLGIFWIATVNTGLGEWSTAFIVLPIAWIEMIIGAWIASKLYATGRWVG